MLRQALSITVNKVVAQMQGVQAICLLTASDNKNAASCKKVRKWRSCALSDAPFCSLPSVPVYSPASPPASPPFASVPATFSSSRPASSISTTTSHKLERRASVQALVSTQPDLSYISEGSQEPSLSLSQQEYKPYSSSDDEGDAEGCQYNHETDEDTLRADQYAKHDNNHRRQPFLLQDLRQDILAVSSASSVEPDYVGQEIEQNLLSASPKRPPPAHPFSLGSSFPEDLASSTSTSASPTPTMPSFPVMPGSFLQPEVEPNSTASQRSHRSAGSSTSSIASDTKGKKARPSLLAQIGISPGHLDISFGQNQNDPVLSANSTERRRSQRSREGSPSPYTAQQSSSSDDEDSDSPQVVSSSSQKRKTVSSDDPDGLYLSKTVRHSTSATTLREKAKAAAASSALNGILAVDASPANRVIARRRSNPTLKTTSDLSGSGKVPSLIFGNSKNDKKRSSTSSLDARPKTASKIVQAMQSRPPSVQLTALDGKASTSSTASPTSKPAGVTISRPRSNSAVHKKLPSVSPTNTKNIVSLVGNDSPAASKASLLGENSPAVNPNVTGRSRARPVRSRSSSPEVEMNTCDTTSVLADMTGSTLPQLSASKKSASPSKTTAKGKAKELSPSASKRVIGEREQTPSADVSSQESAAQQELSIDSVSAANASGREGRRARANVSYQEPSLNK